MKFSSIRFGQCDVPDSALLTFPSGILGFPDWTRYVILEHDIDVPFKWLQCAQQADLAFVIIDPTLFKADYRVHLTAEALAEVQATEAEQLMIAVILTIPSDDPSRITANLRGPLVMNPDTRLCKQVVLSDDHPTRYPLFTAESTAPPVLEQLAS